MNKTITLIIIAVIIAGGSFYAGMKYGGSQTSQTTRTRGAGTFAGTSNNTGTGGFARGAGGAGGGLTSGSIISKDSQSITLSIQTGGSKIVFVSPTTQIMKTAAGTLNDLAVGTNVLITGPTNSDGTVSAQSVQIRPVGFGQRQATSTIGQ